MKTIELKAGQQIAQFTTKSVTFDGKEFFYSRMSNLTHDPAACKYYFTYDGEHKILPYEAKDAPILNAIFGQVIKLQAAKAAHTPVQGTQTTPARPAEQVPAKAAPQAPAAPAAQPQAAAKPVAPTPQTTPQPAATQQAAPASQSTTPQEIPHTLQGLSLIHI